MDYINRKELCELMDNVEEGIYKKPSSYQKEIILKKAEEILQYLKNRQYLKKKTNYTVQDICLSGRQIITLINSIRCLDSGNFLDAYWELWDFVNNDTNHDNLIINEGEYELLVLQINRIIAAINAM